jgi:hypothetical protein
MNMLSVTEGGMKRDLEQDDPLFAASGWRRTGSDPASPCSERSLERYGSSWSIAG